MNNTKTKYQCEKCNYFFSAKGGNYSKHIKTCTGDYKPPAKLHKCRYCDLSFESLSTSERANHSRWCHNNPSREQYSKNLSIARNSITTESRAKQVEKIKVAHLDGKYKDSAKKAVNTRIQSGNNSHSEATKKILREKALASDHRRLLRSTREYIKKDGTKVLLDSSWEEALAIRLDSLGINWTRPKSVKWVDTNGKTHNYFPDFYLTDYDIYLDPKNDLVYKITIEKIKKILEILPNLRILRTLEECKNFTV